VSRSEMTSKTADDASLESSVITLEEYKIKEDGLHISHSTLPFLIDATGTVTLQEGTVDTYVYTMETLKEAGLDKSYPHGLMTDMARFEILAVANYMLGKVGIDPDVTTPHQIATNNETISSSNLEALKLKIQEMTAIAAEDEKGLEPKQ